MLALKGQPNLGKILSLVYKKSKIMGVFLHVYML